MKSILSPMFLLLFLFACSSESETRPMQAKVKNAVGKDQVENGGNDSTPVAPGTTPVVDKDPLVPTPSSNQDPAA